MCTIDLQGDDASKTVKASAFTQAAQSASAFARRSTLSLHTTCSAWHALYPIALSFAQIPLQR